MVNENVDVFLRQRVLNRKVIMRVPRHRHAGTDGRHGVHMRRDSSPSEKQ